LRRSSGSNNDVGAQVQHAIQHDRMRQLWATNSLVTQLDREIINQLKLTWKDIPIERESRIVFKRVAVRFFGDQRVTQYIEEKIAEGITESDVADWEFIRTLRASSVVDLVTETQKLFKRLKSHRSELEAVLREKKDDPDFGDVDLASYFDGV
jgi:hypothetical protein